jgi:hypothetical protein
MLQWVLGFVAATAIATCFLAAMTGVGVASDPVAHAGRACAPPKYPGVGYFTTLTVSGASCSTGKRLVMAYYKCRVKSGKAGRCHKAVLGYSCHEKRNSIPTEIDARVTCKRSGATIVHTYQQDL